MFEKMFAYVRLFVNTFLYVRKISQLTPGERLKFKVPGDENTENTNYSPWRQFCVTSDDSSEEIFARQTFVTHHKVPYVLSIIVYKL